MVVKFDHENKKVRLVLRAEEICEKLQEKEQADPEKYQNASLRCGYKNAFRIEELCYNYYRLFQRNTYS